MCANDAGHERGNDRPVVSRIRRGTTWLNVAKGKSAEQGGPPNTKGEKARGPQALFGVTPPAELKPG